MSDFPTTAAMPAASESSSSLVPVEAVSVPVVTQEAPASVTVPVAPSRSLDEIHQALIAAKEQHARDLAAVQTSKTALAAVADEFRAALSWFATEEKQIAAAIDDMQTSAGAWLLTEIKKLA